jgi:hypothetical protein
MFSNTPTVNQGNFGKDYIKKVLIEFPDAQSGKSDSWLVDDAMKGIAILGGTGSGKTSASGRTLALKYLREGWGGLVLCAKTDEAKLWEDYCEEAGRGKDLIIFRKGAKHTKGVFAGQEMVFNPIEYELKREGEGAGETHNITNIFMNIYRMGNLIAGEGGGKEDRFWDSALKRCINRVVELIKLSGEDLSFKNMVKVLSGNISFDQDTVVRAAQQLQGEELEEEIDLDSEENFCLACLAKALINITTNDLQADEENAYSLVVSYFTHAFEALGERVRATITESFMGLAEPFLSGILHRHFSGRTNIFPEETFKNQKIIVLDFSIKEYLDAGVISQCIFKMMFQQAVERRNVKDFPIPVFLWADEAQYFINSYDQIFLTTARSSRTSTVYLTQNISNYLSVMGSGEAKAKVDSLLGNLSTKIFHSNMDAETNEYASRLIGNDLIALESASQQKAKFSLHDGKTLSYAMQFLPQVMPKEFTELLRGGEQNNFRVNAIIVSGTVWANGKNYKRVTFTQNFKK